jgi:hypothetical protein
MSDARSEISARLALHRGRVAALDRADLRMSQARLFVFAAALIAAWLVFGAGRVGAAWLALPALAFVALLVAHDGVLRRRDRARRAVAFHEAALLRMDGRGAGKGTSGESLLDPEHPYAADLDLFGAGGLFELVCTARTAAGEARLGAYLLRPTPADEARARQRAVRELAPRLVLREELALLGDAVRAAVDPERLAAWGDATPHLPGWVKPAALGLAAAAVAAAGAIPLVGLLPFGAVVVAAWGCRRAIHAALDQVLSGLDRPAAELEVLALLLARFEREELSDARLRALQAALAPGGGERPASIRIAGLRRIAARLEWARNQFFAPFGFLLQWSPLHAVAAERWRKRSGAALRGWLEAVAELEALSSVAGYAFEHPGHVFPEILDAPPGTGPLLEADRLAHPLLPTCVPNDVRLGGAGPRALLVSGSNMSGKSTYLRTVGLAVVLAQAGAPVPAARLRLTPLRPGATLRIQDSLQAGRSRFYAEITRLRTLHLLASEAPPLLFLLDEILHGTNSHDRRIGAEAVVRALLAAGAIGIVTTHDLALTELAATGPLANAHFEDQVRDGQIAFDYTLRPGVVGHSNALALMRGVGLPV